VALLATARAVITGKPRLEPPYVENSAPLVDVRAAIGPAQRAGEVVSTDAAAGEHVDGGKVEHQNGISSL
jgi:hypothetical protein